MKKWAYVLASSSIWKCRILNFRYLLLFPTGRRNWKKSKQILEIQSLTRQNRWATKDISLCFKKIKIVIQSPWVQLELELRGISKVNLGSQSFVSPMKTDTGHLNYSNKKNKVYILWLVHISNYQEISRVCSCTGNQVKNLFLWPQSKCIVWRE